MLWMYLDRMKELVADMQKIVDELAKIGKNDDQNNGGD